VTTTITETDLREEIRVLASLYGWTFNFTHNSKHSPAGDLDLRLVKPPRYIVAELKSEKGKMTPTQREMFALLEQCPGVEVYIWRPSQLQQIADLLAQ